jgi:hypothetical protein
VGLMAALAEFERDFGLAFLHGIQLLPRMRSWKKLKLHHPGVNGQFESIEHLFSATVNCRSGTTE